MGWFQSWLFWIILLWIFLHIYLGILISAGYIPEVLRHRESIRSILVDNVKQLPKLSMPTHTTASGVGTRNLFCASKYGQLWKTFLCNIPIYCIKFVDHVLPMSYIHTSVCICLLSLSYWNKHAKISHFDCGFVQLSFQFCQFSLCIFWYHITTHIEIRIALSSPTL